MLLHLIDGHAYDLVPAIRVMPYPSTHKDAYVFCWVVCHVLRTERDIRRTGDENQASAQTGWFRFPFTDQGTVQIEDLIHADASFSSRSVNNRQACLTNGNIEHMADEMGAVVDVVFVITVAANHRHVLVQV